MRKYLIVNADDFGLSDGVNQGILEAAERGIVTSTSLMVRQEAAEAAAKLARQKRRLSVGLHLDLGEWVFRENEWVPLYSVVATRDAEAVARETEWQLGEFQRLVGRNPTHIDSHQHAHREEPVRSLVTKLARQLGVPVRECHPAIRYCGDFYGQTGEGESLPDALTVANLVEILSRVSAGITELGCHPGYGNGLASPYRLERAREVQVLCAPAVRESLAALDIELCSFDELPRLLPRLKDQHPVVDGS
jgi:predicted glycoside hydrolase/deacetylase ChbG (UPF0249 family)